MAAEKGDSCGRRNLAIAYRKGTGIESNQAEARVWYRLAKEQGQDIGWDVKLTYCAIS